ncbi:hypothetical protein AHZ35_10965 [Salmonella enterica]|jgi:hypothetical protein|uniref:hypothetical protein n=1 Tax=Salmonella enterica TaxID=28901 RepID=UPI0009B157D7|nr:hypothetical protein [Salmonella enterica]EDJ8960367.1 hypothetical protein [Salmonella enterica subsp. enterica serovar Stanley]EED4601453.1 hypothetical protein [Salmonella enterica subsp. enterica serovar Virchow]EKV4259345.1 hypothetical protein [Citrobacter freundii]EAM2878620.1 hypothetical protein [Salmonella enterica]EAO8344592.1 hypothetical protein [Salmonella enterica]
MTSKTDKPGNNVSRLADVYRAEIMKDCEKQELPCDIATPEYERKLNRAKNISHFIDLHIRNLPPSIEPLFWLPEIFSYISDDLKDVLEEIKDSNQDGTE